MTRFDKQVAMSVWCDVEVTQGEFRIDSNRAGCSISQLRDVGSICWKLLGTRRDSLNIYLRQTQLL